MRVLDELKLAMTSGIGGMLTQEKMDHREKELWNIVGRWHRENEDIRLRELQGFADRMTALIAKARAGEFSESDFKAELMGLFEYRNRLKENRG